MPTTPCEQRAPSILPRPQRSSREAVRIASFASSWRMPCAPASFTWFASALLCGFGMPRTGRFSRGNILDRAGVARDERKRTPLSTRASTACRDGARIVGQDGVGDCPLRSQGRRDFARRSLASTHGMASRDEDIAGVVGVISSRRSGNDGLRRGEGDRKPLRPECAVPIAPGDPSGFGRCVLRTQPICEPQNGALGSRGRQGEDVGHRRGTRFGRGHHVSFRS